MGLRRGCAARGRFPILRSTPGDTASQRGKAAAQRSRIPPDPTSDQGFQSMRSPASTLRSGPGS